MARPLSQKEFGEAATLCLEPLCWHIILHLSSPTPAPSSPILLARYRQSHDITDWNSSYVRMDLMEQYHGQASGIFGCDEHLAGNMPSRGETLVGEVPQEVRP